MTIEEHHLHACSTPSDINVHLPRIRHFAKLCSHVTEFGVRNVVSTWALLAGLQDAKGTTQMWESLTGLPDSLLGGPVRMRSYDIADCPVAEAAKLAENEGIDFTFTQADTRDIDIEPTDLLFIDTLHTYEQLTAELQRHAAKVRKFIILHDTTTFGEHGELPGTRGLWLAVRDWMDADETDEAAHWRTAERYFNNNGLTVLERYR